jgi:hypothetical protein
MHRADKIIGVLTSIRQFVVWCVIFLAIAAPIRAAEKTPPRVEAVTPELMTRLNLDPFYRRHLSAGGLPIVSGPLVGDGPFLEAARIIDGFFAVREDVRAELAKLNIRVVIPAADEESAHLPEFARFGADAALFNAAREYGPTPREKSSPSTTRTCIGSSTACSSSRRGATQRTTVDRGVAASTWNCGSRTGPSSP